MRLSELTIIREIIYPNGSVGIFHEMMPRRFEPVTICIVRGTWVAHEGREARKSITIPITVERRVALALRTTLLDSEETQANGPPATHRIFEQLEKLFS